jgi:hypothetical protein
MGVGVTTYFETTLEAIHMAEETYSKQQLLAMLQEVYNDWEELLAGPSEEQITAANLPDNWSIKDVIAHLWGWQQLSVARAEAALENKAPQYPAWPEDLDPDLEEDVDRTNAWIYETNKGRTWPDVYAAWKSQFLRFIELSAQTPESDLFTKGRYAWMGDYPLVESPLGTYEHHREHIEDLRGRLNHG